MKIRLENKRKQRRNKRTKQWNAQERRRSTKQMVSKQILYIFTRFSKGFSHFCPPQAEIFTNLGCPLRKITVLKSISTKCSFDFFWALGPKSQECWCKIKHCYPLNIALLSQSSHWGSYWLFFLNIWPLGILDANKVWRFTK